MNRETLKGFGIVAGMFAGIAIFVCFFAFVVHPLAEASGRAEAELRRQRAEAKELESEYYRTVIRAERRAEREQRERDGWKPMMPIAGNR